ncbi:MAG: arsenate reductase ArsC [candidate division Zixibacteria bacterium]
MIKVLFICTGNSARSIMAEVLMNHHGKGKYQAFSAGAKPSGEVNLLTLDILESRGHSTNNLRSKSIDEFNEELFDVVVTVCDNARESCPVWPSKTDVLHWSFPDPAAFEGTISDKKQFFMDICQDVERTINKFIKDRG